MAGSDNLQVVRELIWHVHNNLMMRSDTGEDVPVKDTFSLSALSQCREFIRCNYPLAEQEAVASTAMAAKLVAEAEPTDGWAGYCNPQGGELNGLKLVAENIEDLPNNSTRFYQLIRRDSKENTDYGQPEKSLIICQIDGKDAGRLCEI